MNKDFLENSYLKYNKESIVCPRPFFRLVWPMIFLFVFLAFLFCSLWHTLVNTTLVPYLESPFPLTGKTEVSCGLKESDEHFGLFWSHLERKLDRIRYILGTQSIRGTTKWCLLKEPGWDLGRRWCGHAGEVCQLSEARNFLPPLWKCGLWKPGYVCSYGTGSISVASKTLEIMLFLCNLHLGDYFFTVLSLDLVKFPWNFHLAQLC